MYLVFSTRGTGDNSNSNSKSSKHPAGHQLEKKPYATGPGPALNYGQSAENPDDGSQIFKPKYNSGMVPTLTGTANQPNMSAENVIGLVFIICLLVLGLGLWVRFAKRPREKVKSWLVRWGMIRPTESEKIGEETLVNTPTPSDYSGTTVGNRTPSPNGFNNMVEVVGVTGPTSGGMSPRQLHPPAQLIRTLPGIVVDRELFLREEARRNSPELSTPPATRGNSPPESRRANPTEEKGLMFLGVQP